MSSNYRAEKTSIFFDCNNPGYNDIEEVFTDLQSCRVLDDTDSQSLYSNSTDLDDDDHDDRQATIHFSLLTKEDMIESNEDFNLLKNKNKQITTASLPESSNDIIDLIREDLYKFVFMPISQQFSSYVRCRVIRNKSGSLQTFRLEVECENDGKSLWLLTAEKQLGQTQYKISVIPQFTNDSHFAELQSNNVTGTSYVLYHLNGDERQQLAVILYETNFLSLKGPRKIEVLLPKFNDQNEDLIDENDIFEHYSKEQKNYFIHLHNKPPKWNPYTCSYKLQFDGKHRVTIGSVKNFQMVFKNEEHVEQIVMQFARISENEFSCDFRYPLSLIQTFGIALSALESRLFRD